MDLIDQQFDDLVELYREAKIERLADGRRLITIPGFPLPSGWNATNTTIHFNVPVGYPMARPDTFWADETLRLASGATPANTNFNTNYGGAQPKLWFSYHPQSWNPNVDDLRTYVRVIRRRLHQVQ